ncbi:C40 family peptidase [Promicromonospora iranensis]|uniref:Cell wall-associated NlpC family hydrolase n=1 Tax=Promicromonospora iranensis TaxID=1105144 RepID=A0ABU2CHH6_9MICO|nr:C40 family peptidase [Promicromonospora iranensis]MDR7380784.1 cell wall-associated NlpC family hydrolase [Promicromonospora iranensis]
MERNTVPAPSRTAYPTTVQTVAPAVSSVVPSPGRGRHRAARRATLAPLALTATAQLAVVVRRGAVAAAGSGLLMSLVSTPAQAAPSTDVVSAKLDVAHLDALTAQAREAVAAAPMVTVAADAELRTESAAVSVVSAAENEEYQAELAAEAAAAAAAEAEAAAAAAAAAAIPESAAGSAVVSIAMRYLGVPYLWAGSTPSGFDCSGFTSYVFAQVGIDLPRTSSEQRYAGTVVSWSEAQPGDLIWSPGHIAIYAGDGMQVEAPVPGQSVRYSSIWQSNPTFIRVG